MVSIERLGDGKVVFLEVGGPKGGLQHITERHSGDFASRGISEAQIPDAIMAALKNGTVVGVEGTGKNQRFNYEFDFLGKIQRIVVGVGSNGYIVTAHPGRF